MLRYDIVLCILLILSIIDFALAAPVLVQEKRQACVDVVHIPKDVITVLGKRGYEEIEKLVEQFFDTGVKQIESSDAHASSSSAPQGPDHGPTNIVETPRPNPASSTANPGLMMEPSSPSSGKGAWGDPLWEDQSSYEGDGELTGAHAPQYNPTPGPPTDSYLNWNYWVGSEDPPPPTRRPASPNEFGPAHDYQVEHVQQPDPGPTADPNFDWNHWMNYEDPPPPRTASPKEFGPAHENQAEHVQQPNPEPTADPSFDWTFWMNKVNHEDLPAPRPASSKPSNPKPSKNSGFNWKNLKNLMVPSRLRPASSKPSNPKASDAGSSSLTPGSSSAGSSSLPKLDSDPNLIAAELMAAPRPLKIGPSNIAPPKEPEDKPPSPESTDPVDHQSLNTDSQPELSPEDRQAALYAAKGKAKAERRISGTARDVGNGAQRELQPAERSLDPGDLTLRNPGSAGTSSHGLQDYP